MAFVPLDSYRTVKVLSQTDVVDVQYVSAVSSPSGFGFAYAVPYDAWLADGGGGLLDVIAVQLEQIGSNGQMVASSATQDLDKNGLLQDYVSAVVEYDRSAQGLPPLSGTVEIPVQAFFSQDTGIGGFTVPGAVSPNQYVVDEWDRLATLAAG
jgi:hypothetical protein